MSDIANKESIFKNLYKKLKPISITKRTLGINLLSTYICILSWSFVFYIFLVYPLDGDKASSLASMFGYSAMMYAPIAAYFLIDNWKDQTKYNEQLKILATMINETNDLQNNINSLRSNTDLTAYIILTDNYLKDNKTIQEKALFLKEQEKQFPRHKETKLPINRNNINTQFLQLKLYSNNKGDYEYLEKSIKIIELDIKNFEAYVELTYQNEETITRIISNESEYQNWLERSCSISSIFSFILKEKNIEIKNDFNSFESDLKKLKNEIMYYRETLD